ncbi:tetratricopeptide repeat protein [Longimicrobium sp.]|uniref:tetratricopeptide repeat protein n=1 Tax=Longimicrobium sp. TaxID=2029185 RepID=UPI002BE5BEE0|nr:tetratricopeptide repeat protein [Longimicrobium sp.]HSU17343.1 tetratricopeptide repeat protein [Longimicrobium sp.]
MTNRMRIFLPLFAFLTLAWAAPARAQDAADRAWAAGNVAEAGRLYEQRLRADSNDVRALHRVALVRAWDGRYDEALALLDRALRLTPSDVETQVDRARVLAWKGDPAGAVTALEPVLQQNPAYLPALQARAQFLSWAGDFNASLQTYGRILEIAPGDRAIGLERARVLSWASRFAAARAAYDSILRRDPRDHDALLGMAQVLSWEGKLDSAEVVYGRLLEINGNDVQAMQGLARTAAWRGDLLAAERRWRRVLARNPDDPAALVGLSQTLRWQGRDAAALEAARRAIRAAPTDRDARTELTWAALPTRPAVAPAFTYETDSDGNRISTISSSAAFRPDPRVEVRADAYLRDARLEGSATPDGTSKGVGLGIRTQLEPGWWLSAGGGVTQTDRAGEDTRASWRAAVSSPGRYPVTATLAYNRTPLDATALLIQREVDVDELTLSAGFVPAQGWAISAGGGGADFHGRVSGETNRRTNGNVAVTRRLARFFTLGAAGRAFGFDQDLNDGYFDPDLYWIGEALGRFGREWRHVGVSAEVAPGIQQVRTGGDRSATLRASGGLSYTVAPGRRIGVSAGYANAGLQRLSPTDTGGGYRYTAVSVSANWAF